MESLRQAWVALRYKHPQIAAVPDETGCHVTYTVPSSPKYLEAWLHETVVVHPESEGHSVESLNAALPPSVSVTLHYLPASRELLCRTTHWRTDGLGLVHLLHEFTHSAGRW